MAQFDVHRNKGALRESIPFVVVVQSAQFERYADAWSFHWCVIACSHETRLRWEPE